MGVAMGGGSSVSKLIIGLICFKICLNKINKNIVNCKYIYIFLSIPV